MAESGTDFGVRQKGVTIVKPFVYGNVAKYFGGKRESDGHSHAWTVYLKPYRNEDMSVYVKKVSFKLHKHYKNPTRVLTKPPYEVVETGWGEFPIYIKIYLLDPQEKPVKFYHNLQLNQRESHTILGGNILVAEFYDELIFEEPSAGLLQQLSLQRPLVTGTYEHGSDFEVKKLQSVRAILIAKEKIAKEIQELKERLRSIKEKIAKVNEDIAKYQSDYNDNLNTLMANVTMETS